ncbi:hypothetical protein EJB05_24611, partial [Eragrostis curvula]
MWPITGHFPCRFSVGSTNRARARSVCCFCFFPKKSRWGLGSIRLEAIRLEASNPKAPAPLHRGFHHRRPPLPDFRRIHPGRRFLAFVLLTGTAYSRVNTARSSTGTIEDVSSFHMIDIPCSSSLGAREFVFWLASMYFEGYGYRGSTFEHTYRCYPASFIDKPQLETGDKIIMPPSALDRLASLNIEYPMLFEVQNVAAERTSHCGVLEFVAEEGMIYMPYWMMQNLLLGEGDMVFIKNANLPKGTYVKLQPHTTDFLDISNPKAILEKTLRNYSCLTTGDSIMVAYNNKKYYIDIVETKPSRAISIIETDCEVDFAPPLDYKEPEKPKPTIPQNAVPTAEAAVEEEPKFTPFTGSGRRLDGKASKDKDVLASSPAKRQANASNGVQPSTGSTSQSSSSRKTSGKLVFGSGGSRADKAPEKEAKEEPKKEEPKFSAFTGKKYSLKG